MYTTHHPVVNNTPIQRNITEIDAIDVSATPATRHHNTTWHRGLRLNKRHNNLCMTTDQKIIVVLDNE